MGVLCVCVFWRGGEERGFKISADMDEVVFVRSIGWYLDSGVL